MLRPFLNSNKLLLLPEEENKEHKGAEKYKKMMKTNTKIYGTLESAWSFLSQ